MVPSPYMQAGEGRACILAYAPFKGQSDSKTCTCKVPCLAWDGHIQHKDYQPLLFCLNFSSKPSLEACHLYPFLSSCRATERICSFPRDYSSDSLTGLLHRTFLQFWRFLLSLRLLSFVSPQVPPKKRGKAVSVFCVSF